MALVRDLQFGLASQVTLLPTLRAFFGDDLKPTPGKFDKYDYESDTAVYEVKTRRNSKDKYPTTCIGADKISASTKKIIFVFAFVDGPHYLEYNKELFDKFEVRPFARYRPGVYDKLKPYVFIPVDELHPIC